MRMRIVGMAAAAMLVASGALAHVIDPNDKLLKPQFKLRADIAKQVSKYTFCLVKATTTCEKKGENSGVECDLATGTISFVDPTGKVEPKFQAAIAKCDTKIDLDKKGNLYTEIGCPGDCNTGAAGVQECASVDAFQSTVTAVTPASPKGQLGLLAAAIDLGCSLTLGGANTDEARIDCVTTNAKLMTKYSQGLFKCQQKCELDVKDKKGNGGTTNGDECMSGLSTDANFLACDTKAGSKVIPLMDPNVVGAVLPLVRAAINTATDGLFNREDPTGTPDSSPCGNCGNVTREGAEECDGADDALCPGACNADCTCP